MSKIKSYITKNGEVKYKFRLYTGINPITNRPTQTSRQGFTSYLKAKNEYLRLKEQVTKKTYWKIPHKTFLDVFNEWYNLKKISLKDSTLLSYKSYIISFTTLFQKEINSITKQDLLTCLKNITTNSQGTINAKYHLLHNIFDFAVKANYISTNPLNFLTIPHSNIVIKKRYKFLSEDELKLFLNTVKTDSFKYYILCRLASVSGMRIGELMALTWNDINFDTHKITINKTCSLNTKHQPTITIPKTKAAFRTIEIDQKTCHLLQKWHIKNTNSLLFPNKNGSLANTDIPKTWIIRYRKKHPELKPISFHTFRHTHASFLFAHQVPPKIIQKRLGHASIKTTLDIYTHLTEEFEEKNIKKYLNNLNY